MTYRCSALAVLAAALLAIGAPPAAAQQAQGGVATPEMMRERAAAYTAAVALAPSAAEQYPRWGDQICPRVAGLPAADGQVLIDHIARRAHAVGVGTAQPGCQPNLIIIFSPDANAVAREIVDTRRDLLGYYSEQNVGTAGREALEAFATTRRPVRWWHVSRRMGADGETLSDSQVRRSGGGGESAAATAAANVGGDVTSAATGAAAFEGADAVRSSGARTRRATRQEINFALIVVDAPSVAQAPPPAVADYVAMAALAPLNPEVDASAFPSILNLFRSDAPATAMTEWDTAFLQGLYRARREAAARQQRNEIARRMAEHIGAN